MKSRFSGFEWVVSDVKDLKEFGDNSFDVVFDKATMDALICDEGSCWDPNETTVDDVNSMCQAAIRVLKPKGKFLQLTFQDPYFRKRYIFNESLAWKQTNYTKIDSGLGYHFFVAEKLWSEAAVTFALLRFILKYLSSSSLSSVVPADLKQLIVFTRLISSLNK